MQTSNIVSMRVNVSGFVGAPVSLYAAYDHEHDFILIQSDSDYDGGPRDGFLKITNQSRDQSYDALFQEADLQDAITSYFELASMGLLELGDLVKRHDPSNKIERDGISDTRVKYRIAPDMTSGQVAVMAACLYTNRQRGAAKAEQFAYSMIMIGGDFGSETNP